MFMCAYVGVCECVYVYMFGRMCVCGCLCGACVYGCMCGRVCVCLYVDACVLVRVWVWVWVRVCLFCHVLCVWVRV